MLIEYIEDDIYNLKNVAFIDVCNFYLKHFELLKLKVQMKDITREQQEYIVNDMKLYDKINNITERDYNYFGNKLNLYYLMFYELGVNL